VIAGACLASLSLAVGSAMADPSGAPTFRALAGSGSDTTQGVLNGLSDVIVDGTNTKVMGSYDAATAPGQTMSTKATPACTNITRPSGSGAGITALINSQTTLLGSIGSISPAVPNTDSVMVRDVYNVVPNSQLGVAPTSTTFVGPTSAVCANGATIKRFGFATNPNCGSTTIQTP
jgi:hypothetical protein